MSEPIKKRYKSYVYTCKTGHVFDNIYGLVFPLLRKELSDSSNWFYGEKDMVKKEWCKINGIHVDFGDAEGEKISFQVSMDYEVYKVLTEEEKIDHWEQNKPVETETE